MLTRELKKLGWAVRKLENDWILFSVDRVPFYLLPSGRVHPHLDETSPQPRHATISWLSDPEVMEWLVRRTRSARGALNGLLNVLPTTCQLDHDLIDAILSVLEDIEWKLDVGVKRFEWRMAAGVGMNQLIFGGMVPVDRPTEPEILDWRNAAGSLNHRIDKGDVRFIDSLDPEQYTDTWEDRDPFYDIKPGTRSLKLTKREQEWMKAHPEVVAEWMDQQ